MSKPSVRPLNTLFVAFGRKKYPVCSVAEAQEKWVRFRDTTGEGVSKIGNGVRITDESGRFVARVSYNGRAWAADDTLIAEAPQQV